MFSIPRFIGGLAVAGLSALVATPTAQAAGSLGYTDSLCNAYYADPPGAPVQTLRCAKLLCVITTDVAYFQPVNTPIRLTASCVNPPPTLTFKWALSAQSPKTCPSLPAPPGDTATDVTVASPTPQTCWYEVVATHGADTGWMRYGVKWH
jgi:hypothetical protein